MSGMKLGSKLVFFVLIISLLLTGCVSGVRYIPPNDGPTAEIVVTSNRAVTNQWVRIHKYGCDYDRSELVGALNNITAGWESTGSQLRAKVKANENITLGVIGLVSDVLRDENGHAIENRYSECYPTAEFYVKPGYTYFIEQNSEIRGDKAYCGYVMSALAANGDHKENVEFRLGKCGRPR